MDFLASLIYKIVKLCPLQKNRMAHYFQRNDPRILTPTFYKKMKINAILFSLNFAFHLPVKF